MYEDTLWYKLAEKHYDRETFEHAKRVANYAIFNPAAIGWDIFSIAELFQVGLLHDILEDTDVVLDKHNAFKYDISVDAIEAIELLTKGKSESYDGYCRRIRDSYNQFAYIVKLADMKDHLSLKETLTPRMKEKYLSGLAELL